MRSRWQSGGPPAGADYDARWRALEAAGHDPHGEADLVAALRPSSVLDAGCGTGRVAIELDRRGIEVVGVDLDDAMLATAREKAPELRWEQADLARLDLGRRFDVVVLAGNVAILVAPGSELDVIESCAHHVAPGGALVAGFQLLPSRLDLTAYDAAAERAGLVLEDRFATWEGEPWRHGGEYAVSVHRR